MKYKDNIQDVAQLRPDYLGFIFYKKSPRYFDHTIPKLPDTIKKVGVFVDEDIDTVIEIIKTHQLYALQLHGTESPEYCSQLLHLYHAERSRSVVKIIKVFSIKDHFNFEVLEPYEGIVDYFLFDTKGKHPGGNGYTFNWNVLNQYPSKTPYFLSGGIGLEETENIKAFLKSPVSKYCYALDVNSKFEIEPGLKNIEELKHFKNLINTQY